MNWIILFIAGLFECAWAVSMKLSNGFTDIKWSILTIFFLIISMVLLSFSLKSLPIGTAYTIWTGIGAIGTALMGILFFNESKEIIRIFFIFLILTGIIGLRIFSK